MAECKACAECGKVLDVQNYDRRRKYCSAECRAESARRRHPDGRSKFRSGTCRLCKRSGPQRWSRGVCQLCYLVHYRAGSLDLLDPPRVAALPCSVDPGSEKRCCSCKKIRPVERFSKAKANADGLTKQCKNCQADFRKTKPEHYREFELRRRYGIGSKDYDDLLAAQNGTCAVCARSSTGTRALAVDHCHTTGRVRGLLCANCNRGIGLFADDPARLVTAAAYLAGGDAQPR